MNVWPVEKVVEYVPGGGGSISGGAQGGVIGEPEHGATRHEGTVVVMVEARGEEIVERVVEMVTVEARSSEEVMMTAERVVTPEEGPEDLERVHWVERVMAVEGGSVVTSGAPSGTVPAVAEAVLSVPVVGGLFVGVAQDLVGLGDLLELFLRVVGLVLVRVELERHLPVGLFDVVATSIAIHAQNRVVVFSGHFVVKLCSILVLLDLHFLFPTNDYCHADYNGSFLFICSQLFFFCVVQLLALQ